MIDEKKPELTEYAGGWIMEQRGIAISGFLKLAFPIILVAVVAYLFLFMDGEVTHSTRGNLVQQLNAVTGNAVSFRSVADIVAAVVNSGVIIIEQPRGGPITHRHFDTTSLIKAFPDFTPTPLQEGVAQMFKEMRATLK